MPEVPLEQRTDEQLACQAQAGCSDAFGQLVVRYQDRIAHFIYRRINNYHDAIDLAQETFTRAWRYLHTYQPKRRFSTWLFTIAYRLASQHGRSARNTAPLDRGNEPAQSTGPVDRAIASERKQNIWATAKATLSDDHYQALWLMYGEQMSVKQVAQVMGKTVVNVKVQLMRARRKLRQPLQAMRQAPAHHPAPAKTAPAQAGQPAPAGGAS